MRPGPGYFNGGRSLPGVFRFLPVFLLLLCYQANAQDTPSRPKIGLALSGGGAHGIAHLGVLKVMEEAGLRPDYITGVSMGSIIGGFYSIGYSPDSIQKAFKSMDWNLLLSDNIPEDKVVFLEKRHFHNSILSLPVTSKKIILPAGLIRGQQLDNMISYYAWPAASVSDFSQLPVPFLCIGTDIKTGRKVVLRKGYLPDAIRASIAIPSVFTPLTIDSTVLVDGGVVRNIAVTELADMGADFLIGSYTGYDPRNDPDIESIDAIIKHIGFLTSLKDLEEEKKLLDVLIEPDTRSYSGFAFEYADSLVQAGYRAALPYRDLFRELADSLNRIAPQKPRGSMLGRKDYTFDKITVSGNKIYTDNQITGILGIKPGEIAEREKVTEGMELLYGKAWFEKVRYRVLTVNDSLTLEVDCIEKPRAMLYGSVHYDDALGSGILLGLSVTNPVVPRSVMNADSYIGQYYRLQISYIQFIDPYQKYGLSFDYSTDATLLPVITLRGETGRVISRNFISGLAFNTRLGLNHMTRLSANLERLNLMPDFINNNGLKRLSYNYFTSTFEYLANTLDNKHFPDRGIKYSLIAGTSKLLAGTIRSDTLNNTYTREGENDFSFNWFYTMQGSFRYCFSPSKKLTLGIKGDALFISNSDSITAHDNFYLLGGIESVNRRSIPMIGFHANQIPVRNLAGLGIEADFELLKDVHLSLSGSVFAIQEVERSTGLSLLFGYGLGAAYMSVIGPVKIGIMHGIYTEQQYFKQVKGYISIGYNF